VGGFSKRTVYGGQRLPANGVRFWLVFEGTVFLLASVYGKTSTFNWPPDPLLAASSYHAIRAILIDVAIL
jgi:hypothetical protein